MTTPSEFAEHVEIGHTIEWKSDKRDIAATKHTVVDVQEGQDELEILVEGARGGRYRLTIRPDGKTDAWHLPREGEEEHLGPLTEVIIYSPECEYSPTK